MTTVNVQDAKANLSRLLAAAERGDDVVIARKGVPVVRLVPVAPQAGRVFDLFPGGLSDEAAAASLAPLDEADLRLWGAV
ncbi:MAG: type II toxin-antitoxin system prevent-host-death family antitoxin [Cellulomonas sp.]|jgi:prevent-host-death family protein|nr:type II toxin-antitoxin system prevent-host-death family antitoxin [Cellulomonas sp.]